MTAPAPRPYAAVDLDGVLADVRHRLPHLTGHRKDWDAFFAAAPDDPPLAEGLAVVTRLIADHDVVYVTGRPERCRRDTLAWLRRHGLPPGRLVMRREGDRRPARLTKVALLRRLAGERPVGLLVDDDEQVCAAARAAGFTVLQADWMLADPASDGALTEAQERDGRT
ncbi:MAG: hypothetical protein M3467_03590 [Actinomycetota bacterium]|jgi:hypothetical protein|nr:hypothetical protein [Acidothermales bacterium]MDQ3431299.1 hypothetical protein [Actinomycetota bacterium]